MRGNFCTVNVSEGLSVNELTNPLFPVLSQRSSQGQRSGGRGPRQLRHVPRRQKEGTRVQVSCGALNI